MIGPFASVADLARGYRDGSATPLGVVEEALGRMARHEPLLNAFACPMADEARAAARQATAELRRGRDRGVLHGIPVAVKDLIEVRGVPTGHGSKVLPPRVADRDAALVARLRAAGAVILGKTNLLEYAYGVAHPAIGQTNNPHDPARTAGGSSGGSAAAVAAGIVPLAVGTDTGGSIRIPAAYCGIVGLKPGNGLVPVDGVFPLSRTLDHAGPLARNVADAAALLGVLSGQEMPLAPPPLRGLRIGVLRRHVSGTPLGRAVTGRFEEALSVLRDGGALVRDIDVEGLAEANRVLGRFLRPEASLVHRPLLARNPGGYAPGTRAQIEAGFQSLAVDYLEALEMREALRVAVEAVYANVDALVSPSVPFVAPFEDPAPEDGEDSEMLASGFANVTGHPSLSLPCGTVDGLPAGMQVTGPLDQDARLLSLAATLELALHGV